MLLLRLNIFFLLTAGLCFPVNGQKKIGSILYEEDIPIAGENCEKLSKNDLIISTPFNPDEALMKTFGGKSYHYVTDYDSSFRAVWYCSKYNKSQFEGFDVGDTFKFPYDTFNETSWVDTIRVKMENGDEILYLFTNTTSSTDFMHIGRFSTGMLGMASFLKTDEGYKLTYLNPGFAALGMFMTIPPIEPIKLGRNNYGFYVVNYVSAPGWGRIGDLHLFGFVNGEIKRLMMDSEVSRQYAYYDNLSFEIKTSENSNQNFSDLAIVISGQAVREMEEGFKYLHGSIKKMLLKKDKFSLVLTSYYKFENGEYKFTKEEFVTGE